MLDTSHFDKVRTDIEMIDKVQGILARRSWRQRSWGSRNGDDPCCKGQAILVAYGLTTAQSKRLTASADDKLPIISPILAAAKEITGVQYEGIVQFNDADTTTFDIVNQVLNRARTNLMNGIGTQQPPLATSGPKIEKTSRRTIEHIAACVGLFILALGF